MRTIVLTTQKGGCGKSILAACLAVAAQEAGEHVYVFDMDSKKSLIRWAAKRKDDTLPVQAMSAAKLPVALSDLAQRNVSLVVVDTPALESPATHAAIKAANLSIVPARPATFDIWASEVTGRKLKLLDKQFAFLLNQCPKLRRASREQEGAAALEAVGTLLRPYIHARSAFLDAAAKGRGVTEVDPKGEAAREMRALWHSLKPRLQLSRTHQ
jgi:chromosome partitioning protein